MANFGDSLRRVFSAMPRAAGLRPAS